MEDSSEDVTNYESLGLLIWMKVLDHNCMTRAMVCESRKNIYVDINNMVSKMNWSCLMYNYMVKLKDSQLREQVYFNDIHVLHFNVEYATENIIKILICCFAF